MTTATDTPKKMRPGARLLRESGAVTPSLPPGWRMRREGHDASRGEACETHPVRDRPVLAAHGDREWDEDDGGDPEHAGCEIRTPSLDDADGREDESGDADEPSDWPVDGADGVEHEPSAQRPIAQGVLVAVCGQRFLRERGMQGHERDQHEGPEREGAPRRAV